ncbi:MAG: NAD-binding protein, partial [Thermodesulfobacteriota bacterium]
MNGNPPTCLIIGCGHFGRQAAERLFQKNPRPKIIIVDQSKEALQEVSHLPIESAVCEGTLYLKQFLSNGRRTDYIVPAVPFHFAFEYILSQLKSLGGKRGKVPPLSGLSNPMKGKTGDLYTSLANFLCPEDCPEPAQYCTVTTQRRPKPLYQILDGIKG